MVSQEERQAVLSYTTTRGAEGVHTVAPSRLP